MCCSWIKQGTKLKAFYKHVYYKLVHKLNCFSKQFKEQHLDAINKNRLSKKVYNCNANLSVWDASIGRLSLCKYWCIWSLGIVLFICLWSVSCIYLDILTIGSRWCSSTRLLWKEKSCWSCSRIKVKIFLELA